MSSATYPLRIYTLWPERETVSSFDNFRKNQTAIGDQPFDNSQLYHGAWVDQRLTVPSSYTMLAKGVNVE